MILPQYNFLSGLRFFQVDDPLISVTTELQPEILLGLDEPSVH